MCCRYLLDREHLAEVLNRLGLRLPDESLFRTRYNIPPGGPIETVRIRPHQAEGGAGAAEPEATTMHWGLIPSWARERKGFGANLANARSETLAEKPVFRTAWRRQQRCLIPASGFYEWERRGNDRQPWLFRRADERPFCFAGLWERWQDPTDLQVVESCTLITTTPNELLARIHDRMPVMLDDDAALAWLQPTTPDPLALLQPYSANAMSSRALIPRVNRVAFDDPECLTPADPAALRPPPTQLDLGF
jgi:putative SOS response-associated peptidase YedK